MATQSVSESTVPDNVLSSGRTEVCIVFDSEGDRVIWYVHSSSDQYIVSTNYSMRLVLSQNTDGTLVNGPSAQDLVVAEVGIGL